MILALLAATAFQSTATLDRAIAGFTAHATGDEGGARAPIDPRLRLASCPTVALSWRTETHDAVVVTCTEPEWRIFVPVKRSAPIPAVAAAAAGAATVAARAEPVIRRGDPVVIEAGTAGFQITRAGVAAGDAAPGSRLAVRVEGAAQPVQAIAVASGRVTLPGYAP